jgi:hypothetical protein
MPGFGRNVMCPHALLVAPHEKRIPSGHIITERWVPEVVTTSLAQDRSDFLPRRSQGANLNQHVDHRLGANWFVVWSVSRGIDMLTA